jgi:hypothetical protein
LKELGKKNDDAKRELEQQDSRIQAVKNEE